MKAVGTFFRILGSVPWAWIVVSWRSASDTVGAFFAVLGATFFFALFSKK